MQTICALGLYHDPEQYFDILQVTFVGHIETMPPFNETLELFELVNITKEEVVNFGAAFFKPQITVKRLPQHYLWNTFGPFYGLLLLTLVQFFIPGE